MHLYIPLHTFRNLPMITVLHDWSSHDISVGLGDSIPT